MFVSDFLTAFAGLRTRQRAVVALVGALAITSLLALAPPTMAGVDSLKLVSRQSVWLGGDPANGDSIGEAVSPNGRFVAFTSFGTNLGGSEEGSAYLRDTLLGRTILVSRGDGPLGVSVAGGMPTAVSDNGRYVVFHCIDYDNALDPDSVIGYDPGFGPYANVYVRDTWTNETELISRPNGTSGPGANGFSKGGDISADGRYVSFTSASSNLSPDATTIGPFGWPTINAYRRDRQTDKTILVSRKDISDGDGEYGEDGMTDDTSISADGRKITFVTTNPDTGLQSTYLRDVPSHGTTLVAETGAHAWASPRISADGKHVLYNENYTTIWVKHLQTGVAEIVGRTSIEDGNQPTDSYQNWGQTISDDGRYVSFLSTSTLLPGGDGDTPQAYVRDVQTQHTHLVSKTPGGEVGDSTSWRPWISGNGDVVVFSTTANNLLNIGEPYSEYRVIKANVSFP